MVNSSGLPSVQVPPPFQAWKSEQDNTNYAKRKNKEIDNPLDETLPSYVMEHDKILNDISRMFSDLTKLVEEHESISPENAELLKILKGGLTIPRANPFVVAFLGEQGIGKSTLLNAVLGRELVTKSAGTSACTSFPTRIIYKAGAPDHSTHSDVTVKLLDQEEMEDLVELQIASYAECYPFEPIEEQDDVDKNDDDSEETTDSSDVDVDVTSAPSRRCRPEPSKKARRDAETAKNFFEIIYGTKTHQDAQIRLANLLSNTDITNGDNIRNGTFFQLCLEKVQQCRQQLTSETETWQNVPDKELRRIRNKAQKFWPLIDSIIIATGHMMLRHNIVFVDLPGYGDTNAIRNALIDRSRDSANFEVVVVACKRFSTNEIQQTYLDRSVKRRGAARIVLVTNRSDELISDIRDTIEDIAEPQFQELAKCFKDLDSLEDEDSEDEDLLDKYKQQLLKVARLAYIRREVHNIRKEMRIKRIEVISTSASQYQLCKKERRDEEPKLDIDATGIPALRIAILRMPTLDNLRVLRTLLHETIPYILIRTKHVQVEFLDDDGYARMRKWLAEEIPLVQEKLATLSDMLVSRCVVRSWYTTESQKSITQKIRPVVDVEHMRLRFRFQTFAKVLRDHGIPVRGKAVGTNLNLEIFQPMESYVASWKDHMSSQLDSLAAELVAPIQSLLTSISDRLSTSSGDPLLKETAMNELGFTKDRVNNTSKDLTETLIGNIQETVFMFTTETNIYSPVARIMKPVYQETLFQRQIHQRNRVYLPMRKYLHKATIGSKTTVFDKFIAHLESHQIHHWKRACEESSLRALADVSHYAQVTKSLVDREFYATPAHKIFRTQLGQVIPGFERNLSAIQTHFSKVEAGHTMPRKTKRRKAARRDADRSSQVSLSLE